MEVEVDGMDADQPPVPAFIPALVNPLLALIQPSALSFPPLAAPSPHPPTTSALSAVHISALECLNNVFLSLASSRKPEVAADVASGAKIWNDVWSALAAVGTQTGLGQERRQEMWEKAMGVLWGIGNVWKGSLVSCCVLPSEPWLTRNVRNQTKSKYPCSPNSVILHRTPKSRPNALVHWNALLNTRTQ